jgi:hypothetical protein
VAVDFLDVAASYRPLPVPLTNIRGRLRYGQSRILLEDLRADALGGRVAVVRGEVQGEGPSRTLNLQIKAQGLDLEHPEAGDLYERVADLREVLEPQGRVNLDCAVSLTGDELESIGARGTFTSDRFVFRDIVVQDLVARLALEEGILSIPSITGQIYGGDLDATFNLDTSSFGAYEGTLHIDGANANPFVEDVFGVSSARLRGVLHADLSFEGFGAGKENIRGAGTVSVTDGWLWEVPLFLGILDAVDPREARLEEARAFRECEARFRIQDGMLRFSRFVVDANTLRIIGRGDMDFAGALNLQVWTTAKEGLPIPVVGDVLSAAGGVLTVAVGTLVGFAVTGTYREPRLEVQPIKLVTDIMGHLLESAGADIPVEEP